MEEKLWDTEDNVKVSKGRLFSQHEFWRKKSGRAGRGIGEEIMAGNIPELMKDTKGFGDYNCKYYNDHNI